MHLVGILGPIIQLLAADERGFAILINHMLERLDIKCDKFVFAMIVKGRLMRNIVLRVLMTESRT
jgi:hypothetical protein